MSGARITHIGGPTALLEVAGWRLLTDPTFDPPGRTSRFGWGTSSVKQTWLAVEPSELGVIDAVLLSHDHHADDLDAAGRALLPSAGVVVTTTSGAERLRGFANVRGLSPWSVTRLEGPGRPAIEVTATPCRHGPPLSHPIVGDVIGFALTWGGTPGTLWITGDTVLFDGVREVASRLDVDTALVHLGAVQFPVTGPLHYTLTAAQGIELIDLVRPRQAIPVHYEGWKHVRQDRETIERAIAAAPQDVRDRVRWLPIGDSVQL